MSRLVFSQQGLSRLVKISRLLDQELGFQFKLSNQNQLAELLRASAVSPVQEIKQCFLDFVAELDEHQRDSIISMGVSLPEQQRSRHF